MNRLCLTLSVLLGISTGVIANPISHSFYDAEQMNSLNEINDFSTACGSGNCNKSNNKNRRYKESIATPKIYQNPFMAPNNFNEIHNNSYQTDTVSVAGPGRLNSCSTQEASLGVLPGIAGTIAFNSQGQILTIRTGPLSDSEIFNTLLLINPKTLSIIASTDLPPRASDPGDVSFAGGGYFFLDNLDRVVCVTSNQQIRIYAVQNNQFALVQTYDLSGTLEDPTDILNSVLPDSFGNLWFISKNTTVGYVNPLNSNIYAINIATSVPGANLDETNTKSFATDENGGIYLVTDYALYRFQIGANSLPTVSWRSTYDRGTRIKPGQTQQGSGTTPTLFNDFKGNEFVAISDNADPFMHVLVFNRNTGELIIQQAVFSQLPNLNSNENSLIAVDHSIIIENNYGNVDIFSTLGSLTTQSGIARVDFNPKTKESEVVWENYNIAIPSVVSQLSTNDGLVYTYAKDSKTWYFAALDYRTGRLVSKARLFNFEPNYVTNNFYSGLNIGPNKTVYIGVIGGIAAWRPSCCIQ